MGANLDSMSREDLLERAQLLQQAKAIQTGGGGTAAAAIAEQKPLGDIENPHETDLYGDPNAGLFDVTEGKNRASASFGNTEGIAPMLQKNGWKNVQKNKNGDLVAQGPDGKFYKDQSGITSHPINWLESKAGKSLPLAGMMLGATGSGIAAAPESLGVASLPAAVAGAGFGGAVGEGARIWLGKKMGTYQGDDGQVASDVGGEGVGSAAAELGGKMIGKVPIPFAGMNIDEATKAGLSKLVQKGSSAATRLSQALTGVDKDAFLRTLNRPDEVGSALAPGNALRVAQSGQNELASRADLEGGLISKARQKFAEQFGRQPVDTTEMIGGLQDALQRNAPNPAGHSGMTEGERTEIQGLIDSLQSQKVTGHTTSSMEIPSSLVDEQGAPLTTTKTVTTPTTVQVPSQPAGSLQRTADMLQEEVTPKAYGTSAPTRSGKAMGAYQHLIGQIKDAFHKTDPTGLGAADARFSDYANKAKILGPIENDATGESFASNLFGANKGAKQEAAQALIPKTYEGMADIGANKAMGVDRASKFGPSAPAILRMGGAIGTAAAGYAAGGSEGGLLGLGAGLTVGAATSPLVHKELYTLVGKYGMPTIKALVANPQLAPALLDTTDLSRLRGYGQSMWNSMQKPGGK